MSAPARHIDQTARMLWLSLRHEHRPMTVGDLTHHWRPTFSRAEVQDGLDRLAAAGYVARVAHIAGMPQHLPTDEALPAMELLA